MEKTLLLIKPDATKARKIGEIISIIESKRYKIDEIIMFRFTKELVEQFYSVHREKEFFEDLQEFMCSGKTVAIVISGLNVITRIRNLIGPTDPEKCRPGTIRGQFATSLRRNAVHASDSESSFKSEHRAIFGY